MKSWIVQVDRCYFWLVNCCLEYHLPIITNTCPANQSQRSLLPEFLLIFTHSPWDSQVGNCTYVYYCAEDNLLTFLLLMYSVCASSPVIATTWWTRLLLQLGWLWRCLRFIWHSKPGHSFSIAWSYGLFIIITFTCSALLIKVVYYLTDARVNYHIQLWRLRVSGCYLFFALLTVNILFWLLV